MVGRGQVVGDFVLVFKLPLSKVWYYGHLLSLLVLLPRSFTLKYIQLTTAKPYLFSGTFVSFVI